MRSVSWQAQHFVCVAGAVFAWQAQLSSCAVLPNLTRRKTKEGRMPGLRPEAKAPVRWAAGNGQFVRFSVTFHHLGRVCVAGVFASSQNRSLNKQRPHSPGANCVQLQDVVALNSVLAVATWAVALALLCLGWRGQSVASGVSRTQVSLVTWCPWKKFSI